MADPQDRALGSAIRRRREARKLRQREIAERLGVAPLVYGRMELGTRPIKAVELRELANMLGVSADDLLANARPVPVEEMVSRAEAHRDAAHASLRGYAAAVVDAVDAVAKSEYGAHIGGYKVLETPSDLIEHLADIPVFEGLTVDAELVPLLRGALVTLAEAVPLYTTRGEQGDTDGD